MRGGMHRDTTMKGLPDFGCLPYMQVTEKNVNSTVNKTKDTAYPNFVPYKYFPKCS